MEIDAVFKQYLSPAPHAPSHGARTRREAPKTSCTLAQLGVLPLARKPGPRAPHAVVNSKNALANIWLHLCPYLSPSLPLLLWVLNICLLKVAVAFVFRLLRTVKFVSRARFVTNVVLVAGLLYLRWRIFICACK